MARNYTIRGRNLPSGLLRELSGNNEKNGQQAGLTIIGNRLQSAAIEGINNSPKIGGEYYYKGLGKVRASLAGAYPASQTGNLSGSVGFRVNNSETMTFGATAEYAKYLQQSSNPEAKPRVGGKIAERPFLSLAHKEVKKDFKRIMANAVMREIK